VIYVEIRFQQTEYISVAILTIMEMGDLRPGHLALLLKVGSVAILTIMEMGDLLSNLNEAPHFIKPSQSSL